MTNKDRCIRVCPVALAVSGIALLLGAPVRSQGTNPSFCETHKLERVEAQAPLSGQDIALVMKSERVLAGDVASARLLNRGEPAASYGLGFKLEKFVDGRWFLDPASPKGPWPKKAGRLPAEGLGSCFRFSVPDDQAEGQYRFNVSLTQNRNKVLRSAIFQIRPGSDNTDPLGVNGGGQGFCDPGPVKNYLGALERAAPLRKVPATRKLPFAPHGVLVYPIGASPLVGRSVVGFGLADEAVNWPRRLNWRLRASLTQVSAKGRILEVVKRKTQRIGTRRLNGDRNFGPRFAVSGTPGYYRVDLAIQSFSGAFLGAYAEYVRVMKPRFEIDMTISDKIVQPDQVLEARLENLGTEPIWAEKVVTVEKREEDRWVPVASVYDGGRRFHAGVFVAGGQPGPCFAWKVPAELEGGQYAIFQRLRWYRGEKKGEGLGVGAPFKVGG